MDAGTWMEQFEYVAALVGHAQGTPYVAVCFTCAPVAAGPLPYTYAGAAPRDQWAAEHAALAGHRVERYDADQGGLRCLPSAVPPGPRQGAAVTNGGTQ